jgi:putative transposase
MNNSLLHRKTLKRYNLPNHIHELTFSCFNHLPLLNSERTCNNLAESIIKSCEKLGYGVVAYVFMPTHVHLLVLPNKSDYSISDFLRSVKQPVARKEISYLRLNEPEKLEYLLSGWEIPKHLFWLRGGGYDRNIINPDYLENSINYIHNNPVRKELVNSVLDWKWSSAEGLVVG